jgi:hypothetical protein
MYVFERDSILLVIPIILGRWENMEMLILLIRHSGSPSKLQFHQYQIEDG